MKYIYLILMAMSPVLFAQQDSSKKTHAKASPRADDVQYKMAKLWGRIDELEIKLKKQEERIQILEKGLMLGVIPEELLKDKLNMQTESRMPTEWANPDPKKIKEMVKNKSNTPMPKNDVSVHVKPYKTLVRDAQEAFGRGQYGRAISMYQMIQNHYPIKNAEGQSDYWIGLSWYFLKEYDLSTASLERLEKISPDSPWVPSSRLYRTKILAHKGLLKQAVASYRRLIEMYPNSDSSEMAQREIQLLRDRI